MRSPMPLLEFHSTWDTYEIPYSNNFVAFFSTEPSYSDYYMDIC
jgi:hypothetical protein